MPYNQLLSGLFFLAFMNGFVMYVCRQAFGVRESFTRSRLVMRNGYALAVMIILMTPTFVLWQTGSYSNDATDCLLIASAVIILLWLVDLTDCRHYIKRHIRSEAICRGGSHGR